MARHRPSRRLSLRPFLAALLIVGGFLPRPAQAGDDVWTPIGPYGGHLVSVAFHPTQPDVLWAGMAYSGVFRSTDRGVTWTPMNEGFPDLRSATFLGVSAAAPSTLYATSDSHLFRSVDGGPWEPRGMHVKTTLAVDPARADVLWAGSHSFESGGIDRSDDGGATWTRVHSLPGGAWGAFPTGFVFDPSDPSTIYAGLSSSDAPKGVARSRDGGSSWEIIGSGLVPVGPSIIYLAVAPDTGVLFATAACCGFDGLASAVYRSADRGDTWTLVLPNGFPVTAGPGGLVLSPNGKRSLDGGLTWSLLGSYPSDPDGLLAAHPSSPGTVFVGPMDTGIFRSTDSATSWREANQGLLAAPAVDLVVDPIRPGTLYASTGGAGLYKTTEGGLAWERLFPRGEGFFFLLLNELAAVSAGGETALYAIARGIAEPGLGSGVVLRSEDSGASWTNLGNAGIPNLRALAVDPKAPRSVYIGGELGSPCPAQRSTDGGETWSCLGIGKTLDFAVHPKRPANVWAASKIVYRSTDRGRTWSAAGRGLRNVDVQFLALAASNQDVAYAGTKKGGVYRTVDGGRSWSPAHQGLPPFTRTTVIALAVHPRNPLVVYAGVQAHHFDSAEGGVFRSTDGGRHWKKLSAGLPAGAVGPLVIDPHDPRTVYAGTSFSGFYAITLRR